MEEPLNEQIVPEATSRPFRRSKRLGIFLGLVVIVSFIAGLAGSLAAPAVTELLGRLFPGIQNVLKQTEAPAEIQKEIVREKVVAEDSLIVEIVEKSSPAVVSIIATKDVSRMRNIESFGFPFFFFDPFQEESRGDQSDRGMEKQRVGSGTGFFVSEDGLIVTNKHVVSDEDADYTVFTSDGKEYQATVLARDPSQDMAVIKVEGTGFPTLSLGNSDAVKVGQTVIAIGNSLGEFSNSVSRGVISGLGRNVTAGSPFEGAEKLTDIIQTDAAINPGNSGGPLLNISGEVIGINVAMAQGAQNIGFALPINQVKRAISDVKETGKISSAFLGVRYVIIDAEIQAANNLPFDYGAIVLRGENRTDLSVVPGSPADKAGIMENDIILEINGQKVDAAHPLGTLIAKHRPGDTVTLKVWHKGETKDVKVTLEERK